MNKVFLLDNDKLRLPLNKWIKISLNGSADVERVLFYDIASGHNLTVQIDFEGQLTPAPDLIQEEFADLFITSYPFANPLFSKDNLVNQRGSIYSFSTDYSWSGDFRIPLEEYKKSVPSRLIPLPPRDVDQIVAAITQDVSDRRSRRITKLVATGKMCNISSTPMVRDYLYSLFLLVGSSGTGSEVPVENFTDVESSIDRIVREYNSTKKYDGDCNAVSTFFTGVAAAMGIPARRIYGTSGKFGHAWPEVYLPNNGWAVVDPANEDGFLKYPMQYSASAELPVMSGSKTARIKVKYVKK
jgi:hypothetical protein